jgi:hypothetical protein
VIQKLPLNPIARRNAGFKLTPKKRHPHFRRKKQAFCRVNFAVSDFDARFLMLEIAHQKTRINFLIINEKFDGLLNFRGENLNGK